MLFHALLAVALLGDVEVFFAPEPGSTERIAAAIIMAKGPILIRAESFTDPAIADALLERHRHNNIQVSLCMDMAGANAPGSQAARLKDEGVLVRLDPKHKGGNYMIIGDDTVLIGSLNVAPALGIPTADAFVRITHDTVTAKQLKDDWQAHWDHTDNFDPNPMPAKPQPPQKAKAAPVPPKAAPARGGIRAGNLEVRPNK